MTCPFDWWPHDDHDNDLLPDDAVTHLCAGDLPPPDPLLSSPINAPGARAGKSTLHHNCHVTNKKWFTKLTLPRQKTVKNLQSSDISNWRLIEIELVRDPRAEDWFGLTSLKGYLLQIILLLSPPPPVSGGGHLLLVSLRVSAIGSPQPPSLSPRHTCPRPEYQQWRDPALEMISQSVITSTCIETQSITSVNEIERFICHGLKWYIIYVNIVFRYPNISVTLIWLVCLDWSMLVQSLSCKDKSNDGCTRE